MKRCVAIYLAGSIQKGHEKSGDTYWTYEDMEALTKFLPEFTLSFLNPADRSDDLGDQRSVFGRDMLQVFSSDVVFVDARERRGLGVGAEMMWAKANCIPVVALAPKDSHYCKSETSLLGVEVKNWVHPFVESLSDCIAEDLEAGARWIRSAMGGAGVLIKGPESVRSAMRYYIDHQLDADAPMRDLIWGNKVLTEKVEKFRSEMMSFA